VSVLPLFVCVRTQLFVVVAEHWAAAQVTWTFVTLAVATVPLPRVTTQVCAGLEGLTSTVTAYVLVLGMGKENVKVPLALTVRLFAPSSWRTSPVPASPLTVPPMV
jgi:hypothetical protein